MSDEISLISSTFDHLRKPRLQDYDTAFQLAGFDLSERFDDCFHHVIPPQELSAPMKSIVLIQSFILVFAVSTATYGQAPNTTDDDKMIAASIKSYVSAFNDRDAKAIAEHWSPEGVYTSPVTGEDIAGQEAIGKEFEELFEQIGDAKLDVSVESVQFISPNVALEQGSAKLLSADNPPRETTYSVVHVKRDGKWLIDRVSEESRPMIKSNYQHLKDLEWLIGSWSDVDGDVSVETECEWTRNQNFIRRSFAVRVGDQVNFAGMQIIGWDPHQQEIRAWTFDSDGGFAEGNWKQKDNQWLVHTVATLPDGRRGSSTSIFRPIDENRFRWQKINRIVDGNILPSIGEVEVIRSTP